MPVKEVSLLFGNDQAGEHVCVTPRVRPAPGLKLWRRDIQGHSQPVWMISSDGQSESRDKGDGSGSVIQEGVHVVVDPSRLKADHWAVMEFVCC